MTSEGRTTGRWLATSALLAALGAVPLTPAPAHAYTVTGHILMPAPAGNGATDAEWAVRCPNMPASQGVQGWVFDLSGSGAGAGAVVSVTGSPPGTYHLDAYTYSASCGYERFERGDAAGNLSFALWNERYLSVYTTSGTNIDVTLTV